MGRALIIPRGEYTYLLVVLFVKLAGVVFSAFKDICIVSILDVLYTVHCGLLGLWIDDQNSVTWESGDLIPAFLPGLHEVVLTFFVCWLMVPSAGGYFFIY